MNVQFDNICKYVHQCVDAYTMKNLSGLGLHGDELEGSRASLQDRAKNVRKSCSGDMGARESTKQMVKDYLLDIINVRGKGENDIEYYVNFDPDYADGWTMAEACFYKLNHPAQIQDYEAQTKRVEGKLVITQEKVGSLDSFFKYFKADAIRTKDIRKYYTENVYPELTFSDKLNVLTQMVFAHNYGLGIIDTLNYQKSVIEEIQIGMSGVLQAPYDYRAYIDNTNADQFGNYAKDSVHVVVSGQTIALRFLSFGANRELERTIRNLIKDAGQGDLTELNPRVVTETVDGRRIAVARPPFQDAWGGLVRLSHSSVVKTLADWDKTCPINDIIALLVRSGANIAITGDMETGKTTLLRIFLSISDKSKNVRVIEKDSFELNPRKFIPGRNASSFRLTKEFDETMVSEYVRKTTGHIFSVGEVNSLPVSNIVVNLAKVAQQVLVTCHHISVRDLIKDFRNARIRDGFSNERLAEVEAAETINLDFHIEVIDGVRHVVSISEIIPDLEHEDGYTINQIFTRSTKNGTYTFVNHLSNQLMLKARHFMNSADYALLRDLNSKPLGVINGTI